MDQLSNKGKERKENKGKERKENRGKESWTVARCRCVSENDQIKRKKNND